MNIEYLMKHKVIANNTSKAIILTEPFNLLGVDIGEEVLVMKKGEEITIKKVDL